MRDERGREGIGKEGDKGGGNGVLGIALRKCPCEVDRVVLRNGVGMGKRVSHTQGNGNDRARLTMDEISWSLDRRNHRYPLYDLITPLAVPRSALTRDADVAYPA